MTISPERLQSLLQRQHDAAQRLLQLLTEEHAAITGNNLQDLESVLAAKQQSLMELETTSREYTQIAPNKTIFTETIRQNDPHGALGLESLWQKVETLLRQCQNKNSINGKTISLSHRHVQQAISILRSGELGVDPCYSPTGGHLSAGASRTLGKV